MARESRRRRDEKRFGRPERLADIVASTPKSLWIVPPSFRHAEEQHRADISQTIDGLRRAVCHAKLFDATEVSEYVYLQSTFDSLSIFNSETQSLPPFDLMFIETTAPSLINIKNGPEPWPSFLPYRFGFLVQKVPADLWANTCKDFIERRRYRTDNAEFGLFLTPVVLDQSDRSPGCLGVTVCFLLDAEGRIINAPVIWVDEWHKKGDTHNIYAKLVDLLCFAILQAMQFLNYHGVTTTVVDHSDELNRNRRKAGLNPFLRFHTININPAKQELRTSIRPYSDGSLLAFHECRGHLKRFTKSFMGRPLEKTLTVWCPPHFRGSAKQGVVISDYKVNAPARGPGEP